MSLSEAEDEIIKLRVQLATLRIVLAYIINATLTEDDRTRILSWLDTRFKPTEDRELFHDHMVGAKDAIFEAIYTDAIGRNRPKS